MAIRIVTDSSADLPHDLADQWNITVVPCNVVVDDVNYKDGVDIDTGEFYSQLVTNSRLPTTAQPSVADFQKVYRALADQGHSILSIHVSGKLSGTLNSAAQARQLLGDDTSIEIIDSGLASIPLGLVTLGAAERAENSSSLMDLGELVRNDLPRCHCFFLLDTLEYLQKGGRIGKAQAFIGGVLSVKPILGSRDGEVHPIARARSRDQGMRKLLELAQGVAPVRQLAVIYSTEPHRAEELRQGLTGLLPEDQIITARYGPTLGTYMGPNAVGVALTQV